MATYLWRTDRLVHQLASTGISQSEGARYAMVAAVLYFQATYLASWLGGYRSWQIVAEFAMVVVIAVVGIHECFRANGGAQGNEFLLRFSALSVPVGIRVTVGAHVFGQLVYFGFDH